DGGTAGLDGDLVTAYTDGIAGGDGDAVLHSGTTRLGPVGLHTDLTAGAAAAGMQNHVAAGVDADRAAVRTETVGRDNPADAYVITAEADVAGGIQDHCSSMGRGLAGAGVVIHEHAVETRGRGMARLGGGDVRRQTAGGVAGVDGLLDEEAVAAILEVHVVADRLGGAADGGIQHEVAVTGGDAESLAAAGVGQVRAGDIDAAPGSEDAVIDANVATGAEVQVVLRARQGDLTVHGDGPAGREVQVLIGDVGMGDVGSQDEDVAVGVEAGFVAEAQG